MEDGFRELHVARECDERERVRDAFEKNRFDI